MLYRVRYVREGVKRTATVAASHQFQAERRARMLSCGAPVTVEPIRNLVEQFKLWPSRSF